jgi:2-polyprenyl-3-methyl-5-hydroxy-6-metoxy-1,4-benzoquinol methylase
VILCLYSLGKEISAVVVLGRLSIGSMIPLAECYERPLQAALENRFGVSTVKQSTVSYRRQQEEVNAYFQAQSAYWEEIYTSGSVQAEIYRARQAVVLAWIDDLALASGSRVLEIGCGAGFLSVALAQRGLRVQAIDSTEAMVELARRQAQESGTTELLSVDVGDVYALAFEDSRFDLVLALGVIPWLARPELAIQEMARVSRPGGSVLLTIDNQTALHLLLDPRMNPALAPLRRGVKGILERIGLVHQLPKPMATFKYAHRFIDKSLASAGLSKTRSMTLGFGPFTLLCRKVLPNSLDIILHQRLQRLAERNVPLIRSSGAHYVVLTRKSASLALERSTSTEKPGSDTAKAVK